MLIRNYGLFWRRTDLFWGRGSIAGHLKGKLATNVSGDPVDFREQQGIYVLYDDNFRLVYVGQAGGNDTQRLFGRLRNHRNDALADRWTKFSWFGIRRVKADGDLASEKENAHPSIGYVLNHIEAILISSSEPPHNRQAGHFGEEVEQYLQFRDRDALGPTSDEMIREMYAQLMKRREL